MENKELKKDEIKKTIEELNRKLNSRIYQYQKAEIKEEDEESKNI